MSEILSSRPEEFDVQFVPGYFCEICADNNVKTNFTNLRDLLVHDRMYHPGEEPG